MLAQLAQQASEMANPLSSTESHRSTAIVFIFAIRAAPGSLWPHYSPGLMHLVYLAYNALREQHHLAGIEESKQKEIAAAEKAIDNCRRAEAKKKEAAQKSMVVIEVKPWEADQDLNALWKKIVTEMTFEGLKWGEACQLVDVAWPLGGVEATCSTHELVDTPPSALSGALISVTPPSPAPSLPTPVPLGCLSEQLRCSPAAGTGSSRSPRWSSSR